MKKIPSALLIFVLFHTSAHAADKIRIGYPDFNSSTFTMPLGADKGLL